MDFDIIVGQSNIKNSLLRSIETNQVGHSYIFCGQKGIGKRTMARVFANALICNDFSKGKSCGGCISCRMMEHSFNPDFYEVEAEKTTIGVDEIRQIQRDIVVKPMYSKRKVYLIADAEKMTLQAQNCLLKTLEEPPSYAVILLTTSNYDSLIDTVRSRVQKYSFRKNSYEEVRKTLEGKSVKQQGKIDFLVAYADGIIGTAMELVDSDEILLLRDRICEIIFGMSGYKTEGVLEVYEFFQENKENVDKLFDIMTMFYRDMMVAKTGGKEKNLINSDKKDIILNKMCEVSVEQLIRSIECIEATRKKIKQNANYQLSIEVMLMKLQEE